MEQPIGACILVINNNQILLGKRKNAYKAGFYGVPGGRIAFDEGLVEGTKRELEEETGLTNAQLDYAGVVREKQEDYSFIHFVFLCKEFVGAPQNQEPEKCEEWEWFSLDNLPDNILRGHNVAIKMYGSGETIEDI